MVDAIAIGVCGTDLEILGHTGRAWCSKAPVRGPADVKPVIVFG